MEEVHVVAPEEADYVGGGVDEVEGGALVAVGVVVACLRGGGLEGYIGGTWG